MYPVRRRSYRPRQDPYYGLYLLAGIVMVLALQGMVFLVLLKSTVGPFSLFGSQTAPDPALTRSFRVAILRSDATAALPSENPEIYRLRVGLWENLLAREGINYRVISDEQLGLGAQDYSVLVLPAAICLGERQRQTIRNFLLVGKGVVASGPLGFRNQACEVQGWEFLQQLTGADRLSISLPASNIFAGFRGHGFFAGEVPPGFLVNLPNQEIVLASAEQPDAFWSDWRLRPAEGRDFFETGLALHGHRDRGRWVWLGFAELLPPDRLQERRVLDSYLTAAVRWAGKQPLVRLAPWPHAQGAAMIISQHNQYNYSDSQAVAELLKQEGVPAVFFCHPQEAKQNPEALRAFRSLGEIAVLGDELAPPTGGALAQHTRELRAAKNSLEALAAQKIIGYAPPFALADTATIMALHESGYRYFVNEMAVTQAAPELVEFTSSVLFPLQKVEVAKLFRTSTDDFDLLASYPGPLTLTETLVRGFRADMERLLYLGGVYNFYYHSYLLGTPDHREAVRAVVRHAKERPLWITTGRDLVEWWSARNKIDVKTRQISRYRIRLDIANTGLHDLENAVVYLSLPYRPQKVRMSSPVFRLRAPQFRLETDEEVLRVDFSRLRTQNNYTYLVHLDE